MTKGWPLKENIYNHASNELLAWDAARKDKPPSTPDSNLATPCIVSRNGSNMNVVEEKIAEAELNQTGTFLLRKMYQDQDLRASLNSSRNQVS